MPKRTHFLAESSAELLDTVNALYFAYDTGVNYWIRPAAPASGLTAFRVSPWRKWGWEHRVSGSLSWVMGGLADAGPAACAAACPRTSRHPEAG